MAYSFSFPYSGHSIAEAVREIYRGEDPWVALGCFLNDWWCPEENRREDLIAEPPPLATTPEEKKWAAFCAAIVEELCFRASLVGPTWTSQQDYSLADPWFYYPQPSQREWLLSTTPEPFKRRNIFVGGNILDNKHELQSLFGTKPKWTLWSDQELQKYQEAN